jgi:hypothetical protein
MRTYRAQMEFDDDYIVIPIPEYIYHINALTNIVAELTDENTKAFEEGYDYLCEWFVEKGIEYWKVDMMVDAFLQTEEFDLRVRFH